MNGFVVEQPISLLSSGDGDSFARTLLKRWQRSDGYLTRDFGHDLSIDRLVMLDTLRSNELSPEILYCGENALAGKVIGERWLEEPTKTTAFRPEFRELVGAHYGKAQKSELPVFDLVSAPTCVDGKCFKFKYERLILPVRTLAGAMFLYCYSFAAAASPHRLDQEPSDEFPLDQHRQNIHPANQFALEAHATQYRADKP